MYALYGFKWLHMTHFLIWWTWYCPIQKKSTSDVASIFKQVSGGVLMRTLVIRLGQDLILQANDYCDRTTDGGILAIISPFQGENFAHSLLQTVFILLGSWIAFRFSLTGRYPGQKMTPVFFPVTAL